MKRTKLLMNLLTMSLISSMALTGCGSASGDAKAGNDKSKEASSESAKSDGPTNLVYYTIGNPDNDLQLVNDALNELLTKKCNLTLTYNKVGWGDYGTKLTNIINSGGDFDIAFASGADQGNYAGNAQKGAWLPLDDFLDGEGKELYDSISPLFWEGAKIDGHIYGIPTNKEVAVPEMWMYPKELIDKYNIDITKLKTLDDLKPVFSMIKEKEPDYLIMELDNRSHNFFALDGYEYVVSKEIPLMVKSTDDKLEVVNIFDTDYAKNTLKTLREFYEAGYINEDAAVKESANLEKGKKVFWKEAPGGPYSDTIWTIDRGYDIIANQVTDTVVTTESARGALMVVNALTKNKEACFDFLKTLNTDPEVRNTINYGVEGTHYKVNADDQVEILNNDTYQGVQYTQGNWFILKTRAGEPKDKWEAYKKFNSEAIASNLLGFQPDTTELTSEIAAVTTVWNKYYSGLMTGSVDVDKELPKFVQELKDAGIEDVQKALQEQINTWKQAK